MFATPQKSTASRRKGPLRGVRRTFPWSYVRGAVVTALTFALVACAGPPPTPDAPTTLPAGISASLIQLRSDVATRQAEVRVVNGTDSAIELGKVSVSDPRFTVAATRVVDRRSTVLPGGSVDVRIQLADVDCSVGDDAESTVTLHYASADAPTGNGTDAAATAPLPEAIEFLAALHQRECVEQGAQAAASVAFGAFTPSPAGSPAQLELVVTPNPQAGRDAPDLTIRGIRETNLLTFPALDAGAYPLEITQSGAARAAATTVLPLRPARCDPHAVQEDKRGTVFRLMVTLDGVDGSFDVAAEPDLRGRILTWVAAWCGYGG